MADCEPESDESAQRQRVIAAYDELIDHFAALGAEPTEADKAWAEQVSPNPDEDE